MSGRSRTSTHAAVGFAVRSVLIRGLPERIDSPRNGPNEPGRPDRTAHHWEVDAIGVQHRNRALIRIGFPSKLPRTPPFHIIRRRAEKCSDSSGAAIRELRNLRLHTDVHAGLEAEKPEHQILLGSAEKPRQVERILRPQLGMSQPAAFCRYQFTQPVPGARRRGVFHACVRWLPCLQPTRANR